jgi:outer membrane protein OmpA-like peptidoglycan-associated protein
MLPFSGGWRHHIIAFSLALAMISFSVGVARGDDCKRVMNILVLFDASGIMKEKGRYDLFLQQMAFFERAMPLTRDGFFNVGIRHYGLKVGLGCENTESILAIQPWDPEKFLNSFPRTVSYGMSSLSSGLRAAADEAAAAEGKTIILLIGAGMESCKADPIKVAERIGINQPELEIHTFQIGNAPDGRFFLGGIAQKAHGTYNQTEEFKSPAQWHAWMKKNLVVPCGPPTAAQSPQDRAPLGPVIFDPKSSSVRSKDRAIDAANQANLNAVGQMLKQNPSARVVLHAIPAGVGNLEAELRLARKRADAVAQILMSAHRIPAGQIAIQVHPSPQPSMPGGARPSQPAGRRVEFQIN